MKTENKISIVLAAAGIVLVGVYTSWPASIGVFAMIWAHNLERHN